MWEGHDYKDPKTNFGFGRTLVAFDPQTKKMLWSHGEQEYVDGRGVCMKNGHIYFYSPQKFLGCLDANTGNVLWRNADADLLAAVGPSGRAQNARLGYATTTFIKCDSKYVYFAGPQRPNLVIASAADGKLVFKKEGGNLQLVLRDEAIYAVGPGGRDLEFGTGGKLAYDTWTKLAELPNRRSCTRATGSIDCVFYRAPEGTTQIHTADDAAWHIRADASALPGWCADRQRHALLGTLDVRLPTVVLRPCRLKPGARFPRSPHCGRFAVGNRRRRCDDRPSRCRSCPATGLVARVITGGLRPVR